MENANMNYREIAKEEVTVGVDPKRSFPDHAYILFTYRKYEAFGEVKEAYHSKAKWLFKGNCTLTYKTREKWEAAIARALKEYAQFN